MRSRAFLATAVGLALSACAHAPPPPALVWVRTDGQRMADNAALTQQGEIDKTICAGDAQRANLSSLTPVETSRYSWGLDNRVEAQRSQAQIDAMKGCMAQKGYVLATADQAYAISAQFAATAAQRQVAPPPPVAPPPRQTAAVKPKPPPQAQPAPPTSQN